jgi:hypothetical protein
MNRLLQRLIDPTGVRPREDIEYYTKEDAESTYIDENGNEQYKYKKADGSANYNIIGLPKTDNGKKVIGFFQEANAFMAKDSFIRDERDYNAVIYDTLGEIRGSDEFSFANRPGAALFSNISGFRLKSGEELQDYEKELIRLNRMTNIWPLSNPKEYKGIKLSYGMQSDLANLAKNVVTIPKAGYGELTFRDRLAITVMEPSYLRMSDKQKVLLMRSINKQYIDQGFETLLLLPEYENMSQAYYDLQEQRAVE